MNELWVNVGRVHVRRSHYHSVSGDRFFKFFNGVPFVHIEKRFANVETSFFERVRALLWSNAPNETVINTGSLGYFSRQHRFGEDSWTKSEG
mmetsp:Transcript_54917/g.75084  ORF Transcript_54917/g.75084 Transcript_54917/m.75084 type:complete len:92 (+) Transcript_54917:571-846(+)